MPTYERLARFDRDHAALSPEQKAAFRDAVGKFVEARRPFRNSLRVKGVRSAPGIFELTWADDGRATFQFGEPVRGHEPHVVWRRVGTHRVLDAA